MAVAETVEQQPTAADVNLRDSCYCYHHPLGIVPAFNVACGCCKPSPYFLHMAAARYGIDFGAILDDRRS
jgi:D-glycero-D-manno-heptose 1,7-bisphosphate phosphatase